jgi:hypothetical protein
MRNKAIYRVFCFGIAVCGSISLYAQNYSLDMSKIKAKYNSGDISFHVKYLFYPFDSIKKATDSMNIQCNMSGNEYYYKINAGVGSYEYLKNSRFYFVIDHSEKAIAVKKSSEAHQQLWDINKIDSIMHSPSVKVKYKDLGKNEAEYEVTLESGPWNRFKIVFNRTTYILEKMYMYSPGTGKMYGEDYKKPMIGIYYSNYSTAQFSKDIFNEGKFFSDTQSAIVLTDSYKKYKLLDYVYKMSKRS